jgi:chemotaxis protein MotB
VVKYLISRGIPPEHLAAAGFAEFNPLDTADTEQAYKKNRRIEMKFDQR